MLEIIKASTPSLPDQSIDTQPNDEEKVKADDGREDCLQSFASPSLVQLRSEVGMSATGLRKVAPDVLCWVRRRARAVAGYIVLFNAMDG